MKVSTPLFFSTMILSLSWSSVHALMKPTPRSVVVLQRPLRNNDSNVEVLLSLRGGGGATVASVLPTATTIAKGTILASLYTSLWNIFHPQSFWQAMGNLETTATKDWIKRGTGWMMLSIPLFYFCTAHSLFPTVTEAALFSTVPSYLYMAYCMLSGAFNRGGVTPAVGSVVYLLWTGLLSATLLYGSEFYQQLPYAEYGLTTVLGLLGVWGFLAPESNADDVGITLTDAADKLVWKWGGAAVLCTGALAVSLARGCSLTESVRNMMVASLLLMVEAVARDRALLQEAGFSHKKSLAITTLTAMNVALLTYLEQQ